MNNSEDSYEGVVGPDRRKMPKDRKGITHKVEIIDEASQRIQEGYITANRHEDGSLGEVFLQGFGKEGSTLEGWIQVTAILFSTALQYGAEFSVIARKLSHTSFPPYGRTNDPKVPYCRSVPDYIMAWLVETFGTDELRHELRQIRSELQEAQR